MTSAPLAKIALGFSAHTGWAQAVAIAGPLPAPKLLHRGRVGLGVGKDSVYVFHVAAEMTAASAKSHIERCGKRALASAQKEIASLLKTAAETARSANIGVVVGNSHLPPLQAVLKSHMLIHAAEGDFYRRAILDAAKAHALKALAVPSKELSDTASAVLKVPAGELARWLAEYGRTVGRPWGRDEKDAFLAACVALAS